MPDIIPKISVLLVTVAVLSGCAHSNPFKGKWSGTGSGIGGTSVQATCTFTDAFVTCDTWFDKSHNAPFGGAYVVRSATEAVAPNAGYDFNILPNGTMTFNNTAITVPLTRISE